MKTTLEYLYYLLIWFNYAYWPCLICVWAWLRWSYAQAKVQEKIALLDLKLYEEWWSKWHHLAMTIPNIEVNIAITLTPSAMRAAIWRQYFFMDPLKLIPHTHILTYGIDRWDHREPWPKGKSWDKRRLDYWMAFKKEKRWLYTQSVTRIQRPKLGGRTRYKQRYEWVYTKNPTKSYIPY